MDAKLLDKVIAQLYYDIEMGEYEGIEILLSKLPKKDIIAYLPDNKIVYSEEEILAWCQESFNTTREGMNLTTFESLEEYTEEVGDMEADDVIQEFYDHKNQ